MKMIVFLASSTGGWESMEVPENVQVTGLLLTGYTYGAVSLTRVGSTQEIPCQMPIPGNVVVPVNFALQPGTYRPVLSYEVVDAACLKPSIILFFSPVQHSEGVSLCPR